MTIKEDFDKLKATLMSISPFMSALLRRARIVLSESVPTACVTPSYTVVVNPKFLEKLGYADKTWVMAHETVHIAFDHAKRGRVQHPKIWNLAADAVVNNMLEGFIRCSNEIEAFSVRMYDINSLLNQFNIRINYDELERMTVEESLSMSYLSPQIYKLLLKLPRLEIVFEIDLDGRGEPAEGEVLQNGDPEIYGKGTPAEVAEEWKKAIVKNLSGRSDTYGKYRMLPTLNSLKGLCSAKNGWESSSGLETARRRHIAGESGLESLTEARVP